MNMILKTLFRIASQHLVLVYQLFRNQSPLPQQHKLKLKIIQIKIKIIQIKNSHLFKFFCKIVYVFAT